MVQNHFLYFPDRAPVAALVSPELRAWPTEESFRGLIATPDGSVRGTAIVFHGNAGHAGHRAYYARALTALGLRVILAEYPGYGPRDGTLSENSLVSDAEQTIIRVQALYGGPIVLVGESLGAGVAAAAAGRQRARVSGLILLTPWDRLRSVAAYHFPWLPVGLLLTDRYDSAENLRAFEGPVLVALAERDRIVPARFGRALYESLTGPKQMTIVSGADHDDWHDRVDFGWWRAAIDFALPRRPRATAS